MTAQKEQIQTLIAEIDSVLQRTTPRLPWVMSGEVAQQRQVLERVRNYLVALQQNGGNQVGLPWLGDISALSDQPEQSSQQLMQALLQEMGYLRANLTQIVPNQQQLTAELVQMMMGRLQESIAQQLAQALNPGGNQPSPYGIPPALGGGLVSGALVNTEGQSLQTVRSRSDQMMVNLDATLNIVFESLQRNIQAYQESLERGIERMHSLGQQGETTLKALLNQLTQQLKADIVAQLQQSHLQQSHLQQASGQQPPLPAASLEPSGQPAIADSTIAPPTVPTAPAQPAAPAFPYAGAEVTTPGGTAAASQLDDKIEAWIRSVSSTDWATAAQAASPEAATVELPTVDLSQLELAAIAPPVEAPAPPAAIAKAPPPETPAPPEASSDETASIDAALKLLEDLSAELEHSATEALTEAEVQLEQLLGTEPAAVEPLAGTTPESLADADQQDELDEFYELFSGYADGKAETAAIAPAPPEPLPTPTAPAEEADAWFEAAPAAEAPAVDPAVDLIDWTEAFVPETAIADTPATVAEDLSLETFFGEPEQPAIAAPPPVADLPEPPFDDFFEPEETPLDHPLETATPSPTEDLADLAQELLSALPPAPPEAETPPEAVLLELPEELFITPAAPQPPEINSLATGLEAIGLELTGSDDFLTLETEETTFALEAEGSLADLFAGIDAAATRAEPVEPPALGTEPPIATSGTKLSEVEQFFTPSTLFQDEQPGRTAQTTADEDYIRAAPDENLLPDAPVESLTFNVELDDLTLNSLSEDLSQLENSVALEEIELGDLAIAGFEAEAEFTLEGLAADIEPPSLRPDEPTSQDSLSLEFNPAEFNPSEFNPPEFDSVAFNSLELATGSAPTTEPSPAPSSPEPPTRLDDLFGSENGALNVLGQTQTTLSQTDYPTTTDSLEEFASGFTTPAEPPADTVPFYQASADIGDLTIAGLSAALGDELPNMTASPAPLNPQTFTLDDTAQLFGDAPAIAPQPQATPPATSSAQDLTLGGDDWFSDAPAIAPQPQASPTTQADTPFTLEGDDLFAEVPAIDLINTTQFPTPGPTPETEAVSYTLEGMDDLFGDAPSLSEASSGSSSADAASNPFADAQRVDWAPTPVAESREIPPFRPDLFMNDEAETLPSYQLEQLDNLFTEPVSGGPSTTGNTPPSARRDRQGPTPQKLNEAFESLFGRSGPEIDPAQPSPQKKKYLT